MNYKHVSGKNKHHEVKIFTLSTCSWCKKTKDLLQSLEVEYDYVDVDTLQGDDLEAARNEVKKYNSSGSYPTLIVDNGKVVIVGYKEDEIRKVFT